MNVKSNSFQNAIDRKRNRRIPKKRGLSAPKRNSSSLSFYHFDWTDLFLATANGKLTCSLNPGTLHQVVSPTSGSVC